MLTTHCICLCTDSGNECLYKERPISTLGMPSEISTVEYVAGGNVGGE